MAPPKRHTQSLHTSRWWKMAELSWRSAVVCRLADEWRGAIRERLDWPARMAGGRRGGEQWLCVILSLILSAEWYRERMYDSFVVLQLALVRWMDAVLSTILDHSLRDRYDTI